jgi:hypothetical protein
VTVGAHYTFVLTDKGLYACGFNNYGQLGLGHRDNLHEFQQVQTLPNVIKDQGRQQRLFRYLLKSHQSPHFFQPVSTIAEENAPQADRTFMPSL